MKTVKDLGRTVKQKYPEYRDMSDEEVGLAIQRKFPGKYDEYTADYLSEDSSVSDKVQVLLNYYNPRKGRFTSWWQRDKSGARTRLLEVLNQEQARVLEQAAMYEHAVLNGEKTQAEHQVFIAEHQYVLFELKSKAHLLNLATEEGLTVESDQALKLERGMSAVRVDEHKQITEIDLDRLFEERREAVRLGLLASALSEHQKLFLIQELLDLSYKQMHDIQSGVLAEPLKARMIEDREEVIATLKEDRRARQNRLLQANYGQDD